MVDALPLLLEQIQDPVIGACGYRENRGEDFRVGHDFLFANQESVLFSARAVASLFAVALLCAVWFAARKPVATIGGSALLVYEGEFDLTVLAAYQHLALAKQELGSDRQQAMAHAEAAAALAPNSAAIHSVTCSLARLRGESERAERECNLALELTRSDPTASPADAAGLLKFMQHSGMKIHAQ